jgi:hypothetical protein
MPSVSKTTTFLLLALAQPSAQDEQALAAGLAAIRADHIRADVVFFSDDELRGRDTPSHELRIAARFLRARVERLGLLPGADGDWFHEYEVETRRVDVERSGLTLRGPGGETDFVFGEDYFVHSLAHVVDHDLAAPLVFVGAGKKRELAGVDLDGRWALCVVSSVSETRLLRNVERAGAAGLVVVPAAGAPTDTFRLRFAKTTEKALAGIVSREPRGKRTSAPMPTVFLSRGAGAAFLAACGVGGDTPAGTELGVELVEARRGSGPVTLENVCALWPGTDPVLASELVVVSAHYDHLGVEDGEIMNGADDNASGAMGLLALAEALVAYGPTRRSVLLLWLSGEEKGLWGSVAWTTDPVLRDGDRPICNVNVDMIGRNAPDALLLTPSPEHDSSNGLSRLLHELAPAEGITDLGSADPWWNRSDQFNFARNLRIPVVFLFADEHEDYHRHTDTHEKLDYDKVRRVTRLVLRAIDRLQADELDLE